MIVPVTDHAISGSATALTDTRGRIARKAYARCFARLMDIMGVASATAKTDGKAPSAIFRLLNAKCQLARVTVDVSKANVIVSGDGKDRFATKVCICARLSPGSL